MRIYNTLTRRKEELKTITPGEVKIYACGPTVYNYIHIGNSRPLCVFDTLRRYLEYRGYKVNFVQNFTDIDDKIIKKAIEENSDYKTVSEKYIKEFWTDAKGLNFREATVHPKATENIDEIINIITTLVEKGYAYPVENGDVYFSPKKFSGYGKLSHQPLEELEAGARINIGELKREPMDFALWKGAKPGEPYWESPWGKGRPGWHIECSAMVHRFLGNTIDIHCGGQDLIFPHHENEIAQSEGCTGCHFVDYWLHNGFITINSEKMSKSLNNFFLVKDVLEKYSGDALRYFLLSTHYRSPLDFSDDRLEEAEKNMEKLKDVIARVKELSSAEGSAVTEASKALVDASDHAMAVFHEAMDDDFNTGLATGAMFEIAKAINVYYNEVHGGIAFDKAAFEKAGKTFKTILDILGILEKEWKKQEAYDDKDYSDLMDVILAVRQSARKAKQYQLADEIRDKLGDIGIVIEDTPTGARWKKRGV